ncbi:MAG: hypothetical protein LHV69_06195 [Elusimicrobia bacterium]|nr:hypothetical protein [Candidatus Obscuribacterium magneticum]
MQTDNYFSTKRTRTRLLILFLLIFWPLSVKAQGEVVAVLSSDLEAYQEALDGFTATFGEKVPVSVLTSQTPSFGPGVRLIVAFGGKAALTPYPKNIPLIYCLSPGTQVDSTYRSAPTVRIEMLPSADMMWDRFSLLRPPAGKMAVFWISDIFSDYVTDLGKKAPSGIAVVSKRINTAENLPDALREMHDDVQTMWLLPDPKLITPDCFATLKEFSLSNKIPLYVPTAGLVLKGAVGGVAVSFHDVGVTAAEAARQFLRGSDLPPVVFSSHAQVHFNLGTAALLSLDHIQEIRESADTVYP